MPQGWDPVSASQPIPPQNGQVTSPFERGVLDVRWDNPALLAGNSGVTVVGVNVYRSDVSDRGPYFRVNEYPIGGTFFRDRTENVFISRESVLWDSSWITKGNAPNNRKWVFKTQLPIAKQVAQGPFQTPTMANAPTDVTLSIDGVIIPVQDVFGISREVTLINQATFDQLTEKNEPAALPTESSTVEISYWTNRNHIRSGLDANLFYRLTTVVLDSTSPSGYKETALNYCPALTLNDVETMDYIWREAVRRNYWILQQGGERAKLFIRRQSGVPCTCQLDDRLREYSKQPSNRCHTCFPPGTEITLADFTRKPIEQVQRGETVLTHTGSVYGVSSVMSRCVEEPLTQVTATHGIDFSATGDHPVLLVRKEDARCQRLNKCICTGPGSKKICVSSGWRDTCQYDVVKKQQWVQAEDIRKGDYLVFCPPPGEASSSEKGCTVAVSKQAVAQDMLTHVGKGSKRKRLSMELVWQDSEQTSDHRRTGRAVSVGGLVLYPVQKIGTVPYKGLVYNLEVEGDHSYIVNGIAVHNCYGTGFVGGYEGPHEIIIAPDDAERRLSQLSQGRRKEHTYEVWTGPSPVITQRDFIVKQTNERYSVGPVRRPSNRGNRLQQHFNISYFDEQDIRYSVPIDGTASLPWPQTRYAQVYYPPMPVDGELRPVEWALPDEPPYPVGSTAQTPMETEKASTPAEREQRGRTPPWENQNYVFPFVLVPLLGSVLDVILKGL